ncbi:hypothetical protein EMCRGX_G027003 [Ephydatia muelleri]
MCEIRFPAYLMSPTILNPLLFRSEALERQNLFFAQQRASGSILHYDEGQDVMFCHTCVTAFKLGRIKSSKNAATAFVTSGFCNWKDATVAFSTHFQSKSQIEAVEAVITLPKQTKDVGAQLSIAHKAEKEEARDMLQIILSSVRFLPGKDWPFVVDETRDQSNKEQLTLVLRWVSDDFTVSEEFVGLYYLSVIDAQSIVDAINDAFLRFQIPFTKLRGQCYDGCSTMAGARAGVAVKIQELEPRAVFTHHALNLAVNDTITKVPKMKDCLDTCYEIVKLIKFSPKRDAMLSQLKE